MTIASAPGGRYQPGPPGPPAPAGYRTSAVTATDGTDAGGRHAALTRATAGVRVRRGAIPVEWVLLIAASILFPLGVALVLLGWDGAAHTGKLYEQIDYLISGGLLGVALATAGGFMYFGYWLSRQLRESRRQNALTLQALRRLEDAMQGAATNGRLPATYPQLVAPVAVAAAPPPAAETGQAAKGNGTGKPPARRRPVRANRTKVAAVEDATTELSLPLLVATPRGSLLHRPECPVVARHDGVRAVPAGTEGFGYCTMCDAAGAVAPAPRPARRKETR
jgi:hypothetical protein